ncbi:hypothetical protein NB640_12490 [Oxalobacter vibrioformis]|uniref:Uncharacterized protein n=1 Tax=Oxalobacter vibrioformis TaxID=933080 RepID=A0A9E9LXE7_9BURK|nr:hypothetical protein [Oxalobacter vibrioformis]WAW10016.1 hypothetical protein NB640_12490 [Oxalobacter vibrioformis]
MNTTHKYWHVSGCGRLEIQLTLEQANYGYHSGQCYEDVKALMLAPEIKTQLDQMDENSLRDVVSEYSDWDVTDHEENKIKFLWLASADIVERSCTGFDFGELSSEAQQTAIDNYLESEPPLIDDATGEPVEETEADARDFLMNVYIDRRYTADGFEV